MKAAAPVDIRALLAIALDEKPPAGLPDRVMARIAMLTTIVEFGRLLAAAPLDFLDSAREEKKVDDDDDDGSSGAAR